MYDAKTDDKEKNVKNACFQYLQLIQSLPLSAKVNLRGNKIQEYLHNEQEDFSSLAQHNILLTGNKDDQNKKIKKVLNLSLR